MDGKALLAKLKASVGIGAVALASAEAVAAGRTGLSDEEQARGTEALEQLVAAAHLEGENTGKKTGQQAERERLGAVLTSEEAAGRMGLAITLLSTTDNTPEQIASALKASPKEIAATTAAPAGAGAGAEGSGSGQRAAADPLGAGGDAISQDTPLVPPGQPGSNGELEEGDTAAIDGMWKGALAAVNPGLLESGGAWGFMSGDQSGQRAN